MGRFPFEEEVKRPVEDLVREETYSVIINRELACCWSGSTLRAMLPGYVHNNNDYQCSCHVQKILFAKYLMIIKVVLLAVLLFSRGSNIVNNAWRNGDDL